MNEQYYDKDILSDDLVLLNDKLVTERLDDNTSSDYGVPKIPSYALFLETYKALSGVDNKIREYAEAVSAEVETSANAALAGIGSLREYSDTQFLHLSGGEIVGDLSVSRSGVLTVENKAKVENLAVKLCFSHGGGSVASSAYSVALGRNAIAGKDNQFVWNSTDDNYAPSAPGTFNVNPQSGSRGFYIGDNSLCDIVHNDVTSYADGRLSNYAEKENIRLEYDSVKHEIRLSADDVVTTIDAGDFIKDGMVESAWFTTDISGTQGRWICIQFNGDAKKDPVYIDVDKFIPFAGDGLRSGTEGASATMNVDWSKVTHTSAFASADNYYKWLAGAEPGQQGAIKDMSSDISSLKDFTCKNLKYVGYIDVDEQYTDLSSCIHNLDFESEDRLVNGAFFRVNSVDGRSREMSLNGKSRRFIETGDYITVHSSDVDKKYVPISSLEYDKNLFIVRSSVTYNNISAVSTDLNIVSTDLNTVSTDLDSVRQKLIDLTTELNVNRDTLTINGIIDIIIKNLSAV